MGGTFGKGRKGQSGKWNLPPHDNMPRPYYYSLGARFDYVPHEFKEFVYTVVDSKKHLGSKGMSNAKTRIRTWYTYIIITELLAKSKNQCLSGLPMGSGPERTRKG
jgi:hypothetical protein